MNLTPLVLAGVSIVGSFLGAFIAMKISLARFEERLKAFNDRLDRHSNRLNRIEDKFIKA